MTTVNLLKKLSMATAGAAVMALGMVGTAQATVLTFDNVGTSTIPNGYGGFNWNNFGVINGTPGTGYDNGTVSGDYVAFNEFSNQAITSGSVFDFNGAYLTGAWNDNLSVVVEGLKNGISLYSKTTVVNTSAPTWVNFNFLGIDQLKFSSSGGVPHPGLPGAGTHFAMDNFTFNETTSVPEPASLIGILGLGAFGITSLRKRKQAKADKV